MIAKLHISYESARALNIPSVKSMSAQIKRVHRFLVWTMFMACVRSARCIYAYRTGSINKIMILLRIHIWCLRVCVCACVSQDYACVCMCVCLTAAMATTASRFSSRVVVVVPRQAHVCCVCLRVTLYYVHNNMYGVYISDECAHTNTCTVLLVCDDFIRVLTRSAVCCRVFGIGAQTYSTRAQSQRTANLVNFTHHGRIIQSQTGGICRTSSGR